MEKAFDRVWHDGLLYKLSSCSTMPPRILRVVASFLSQRRFRVAVEGEVSDERAIEAGVPQGSCLSPVLYACYTDDIPTARDVQLALFADDAAYFVSSVNVNLAAEKAQAALDLLPSWLSKWRLSVNVAKTQATLVSRAHPPAKKLTLYRQEIAWSTSAKYLGVTIDNRLSMKSHVRTIVANVRATRAMLRPVLASKLPLRTKLGIYKCYIRSRLTYAAPAWYALASRVSRGLLSAQQNLCLRHIVGAPRYVRNATIRRDLGVEELDEYIRRLATTMFCRADASDFPHIRDLAPLHARPPDGKALPRELILPTDAD